MIAGLLHRKRSSVFSGVIGVPAYQSLFAMHTDPVSASALATFNVHSDGTWTSTGTGHAARSGSWHNNVGAGIGSGFDVRVTPTLTSGSQGGVLSNSASSFVALSSDRQLQVALQRFTGGTTTAYYSVLVEIRVTGGAVVSSAVFTLAVSAQVATGGGAGPGGYDEAFPPPEQN